MDTTTVVIIGIILIIVALIGFTLGTRAEAPGLYKKDDCRKKVFWFFGWWVQCTSTCVDRNKECRLLYREKGENRWIDPHKRGTRWKKGLEYTCDCRRR